MNIIKFLIRKITNYFLNKKYIVKDKNKNNIFSIRLLGGNTLGRAETFYTKEPDTVKWIENFHSKSTFFDIGANIGIYSLYAAKLNHSVVAFEPESLNFAALNVNISDNNFVNKIKAYPISVDEKSFISDLNISQLRFGGSFAVYDTGIIENTKVIKKHTQGSFSLSLDDFIEKTKIVPDYIKIDVPSNELRVVKGLEKTIREKKIKSLLIEFDECLKEHEDMILNLEKVGYKVRNFNPKSNHYILYLN